LEGVRGTGTERSCSLARSPALGESTSKGADSIIEADGESEAVERSPVKRDASQEDGDGEDMAVDGL
jgi:hypothetical protein